jgi:hypothetical protein
MQDRPDAITRFVWSLRHHWARALLVGLTFMLLLVGGGSVMAGQQDYSARALIVPRELGEALDVLRLSRFQQAVFENGGVVEASLQNSAVPYTSRDELLDHVELAPVEDNIALSVVASDEDPEQAAEIANAVAGHLVRALNRSGEAAGVFHVHTEASPPAEPDPTIGLAALLLVGAFGGIGSAAGVTALVGATRRPVLSPGDAQRLLAAPMLGHLLLPVRRTGPLSPIRVPGLSALLRRLYPDGNEACAFVASRGSHADTLHVTGLVARALARRGPVLYVAPGERNQPGEVLGNGRILPSTTLDMTSQDWSIGPAVVEAPVVEDLDLPGVLPEHASIVVVVFAGERAAGLERLRQQFAVGEIAGLLFVERSRRPRGEDHATAAWAHNRAKTTPSSKVGARG